MIASLARFCCDGERAATTARETHQHEQPRPVVYSHALQHYQAGDRLVFARRMAAKADHLARHRLADLFLDASTYNGHTTACDALWAGLPVLTCPGDSFASRVGASLLTAVGLPELIAADQRSYEDLAEHPEALRKVRDKLAAHRATRPLFDSPRHARNLERAYRAMWDVCAAGQPPRPIVVTEPADESSPSARRTSSEPGVKNAESGRT